MIDRKLIGDNAPLSVGQQIHVNHVGCSAGEDTKRRLYIRRTTTGIVAYCHHCSESGYVGADGSRLGTWVKETVGTVPAKFATPPRTSAISTAGAMWLAKYYCSLDSTNFAGVEGSPSKVALRLYDSSGTLIGIQVRNLVATPKYVTYFYAHKDKGEASWFTNSSKTLVITEDYLSAYRVRTDYGSNSLALLRTSLTDSTLRQIFELNYERIHIWLDPDQAGIDGASKVMKKLKYYLPSTTLIKSIKSDKEPKELTKEELVGLLCDSSM
jgi:hypothetical protein